MAETFRPQQRIEIRQQNAALILRAAEKIFAEAGFGGATMPLIRTAENPCVTANGGRRKSR